MGRFLFDPTCLARLEAEPELVAAFEGLAQKGGDNLRSVMPEETGAARASVEEGVVRDGGRTIARWGFGVPYWFYLEFGTSDTPKFAPLARSLDMTRL